MAVFVSSLGSSDSSKFEALPHHLCFWADPPST
ncbi:hypothetical protein CCACVL1_31024 [Corchorus capsularis]|uniref:Uncharacterized protein n=1 Tax=Corchorus capsularis TaxID=210143 RepID=A0A1R3FU83_COCAP|nr:hypothetical protein CCACVL1_31024 [Corchorus capsularis]